MWAFYQLCGRTNRNVCSVHVRHLCWNYSTWTFGGLLAWHDDADSPICSRYHSILVGYGVFISVFYGTQSKGMLCTLRTLKVMTIVFHREGMSIFVDLMHCLPKMIDSVILALCICPFCDACLLFFFNGWFIKCSDCIVALSWLPKRAKIINRDLHDNVQLRARQNSYQIFVWYLCQISLASVWLCFTLKSVTLITRNNLQIGRIRSVTVFSHEFTFIKSTPKRAFPGIRWHRSDIPFVKRYSCLWHPIARSSCYWRKNFRWLLPSP